MNEPATQGREPFCPLRYSGIKNTSAEVCEHCDRTYMQSMPLEGLGRDLRLRVQCDDCGDMGTRLDALLRHGFDLRDRLAAQRRKNETTTVLKTLAELESLADEHRRRYKRELDACRQKVQEIRRQHGK